MPSLEQLKERYTQHPDVWPGERLRVHAELFAIRLVRGFGFFATTVAGFAIAAYLGRDDVLTAEILGAIGVALAASLCAAWFFLGEAMEKWRFARALRVADRKRDVARDGVNVGGASVAFTSMPAPPQPEVAPTLQRTPILEGLYAPHEVPEEVER